MIYNEYKYKYRLSKTCLSMSLTPHSPMACEAQLLSLTLSRVQGQQECHSWQGKACIHGYSLSPPVICHCPSVQMTHSLLIT